jgi:hypothetical protein
MKCPGRTVPDFLSSRLTLPVLPLIREPVAFSRNPKPLVDKAAEEFGLPAGALRPSASKGKEGCAARNPTEE